MSSTDSGGSIKPRVPTETDVLDAYSRLQSHLEMREKEWVTLSQWTRFDPRLAEIWLTEFGRNWRRLSPVMIRAENLKTPTPAVLGLLLDQYHRFVCPKRDRHLFGLWSKVALYLTPRADSEQFFIGVLPFAGTHAREASERPGALYKKWGFFGQDIFVNKFAEKQKSMQATALAPPERMKILKELLRHKKRITVADYVEACKGLISRRVAQMDLEEMPGLRGEGQTRGRTYSKRTH